MAYEPLQYKVIYRAWLANLAGSRIIFANVKFMRNKNNNNNGDLLCSKLSLHGPLELLIK